MRRWARPLAAVVALAGCGQGSGGADQGKTGPEIRGVLRDERGEALGNAEVLACQATICQFGVTDDGGRFTFTVEPPAEVAIKTREDMAAAPPRGSALYPVRIDGPAGVDLEDVHVPHLPSGAPLAGPEADPQTLDAGDGLEVTLRRADLVAEGHALTSVAARRIPEDRAPRLADLEGENVVALFALHPFGVTSRSPIGIVARTNLPAGTAVRIRTISDLDGTLSPALAGTSDGTAVTTAPGEGVRALTWLVITR